MASLLNTPNPMITPLTNGIGNNFYDSLKGTLMSMFVYKGMSGNHNSSDAYTMIYIFIITNIIETVMKILPIIVDNYIKPHANISNQITELIKTTDEEKIKPNEAPKTKTASITYSVNLAEQDNIIGQSVIDYVTNCKNTKHVSFVKKNYILNQKDIIEIDEDYYAKLNFDQGVMADQNSEQNNQICQTIEIFSFTKDMRELRNYIQNITERYIANKNNQLGNRRFYFNAVSSTVSNDQFNKMKNDGMTPPFVVFTMKEFKTNRKFSNLFGEHIDIIRKRVQFFINNKKWYDEKGIPYTLGLLLAGNPGTGKTSCIKCLANETNRHIININLNSQITKKQLENLFFNEEIQVYNQNTLRNEQYKIPLDKRIYVFEDIDCQNETLYQRNETIQKPKEINNNNNVNKCEPDVDLSFLLNLFDGILETPGRIIIMTSNHYQKLDRALIRPGRIDIISEFEDCSHQTIKQMFEFFYSRKLTNEESLNIDVVEPKRLTPAEISKILFENFNDIETAIEQLNSFTDKKIREEEKRKKDEEDKRKKEEEEKRKKEEEEKLKIKDETLKIKEETLKIETMPDTLQSYNSNTISQQYIYR